MNFKAEVLAKKQLANEVFELDLKLIEPQKIDFQAGQFVQLLVSEKEKREYSIITPPQQDSAVSFCVNVSPMGPGSKYIGALKVGDIVQFEGPHGLFVVRAQDRDKDQLFIATGTGIAPFKSMILDLLQNSFENKITLLFGVRSESESFYFREFEELAKKYSNFDFVPCLSRPSAGWQGFHGRVTDFLRQNIERYKDRPVYICGGPPVIKDVRSILISNGFSSANIRLEIFT